MPDPRGHDTPQNQETAAVAHLTGLRAAMDAALFYLLLCAFGILCLLWSMPAGLLAWILPPSVGRPLGQKAIYLGFRLYVSMLKGTGLLRCDLSPLEALRKEHGVVIAANHPSLLDAVMLLSCLPRGVCIAKASIWKNVLLGGGMRLAGYVRNDAPLPMIRHSAEAVCARRQLLIFPEGTRTRRGTTLGPFSRSFAMMAQRAGAPVQTVLIECESEYLRKNVPLFRVPRLPLRYRVRLGERFWPRGDAQAFSQEVETYLRATLPQSDQS